MDNNKYQIHSLLVSCWSIRNSALQSARVIFIAVESIFLSIGVAIGVLGDSSLVAFSVALLLVLTGIYLSCKWIQIVRDCGLDDWYFRWQLLKLEAGETPSEPMFTGFRKWRDNKAEEKLQKLKSDALGQWILKRPSLMRRFVDKPLPWVFISYWILLLGFVTCRLILCGI